MNVPFVECLREPSPMSLGKIHESITSDHDSRWKQQPPQHDVSFRVAKADKAYW
jgi:hypothetical protein